MTRTQIQQLVVIFLLILFVAAGLTPGPSAAPEMPAKPAEPPAPAPESPAPDLSIPRDVFLLPAPLLQLLQQREQEAAELERKRAEERNLKLGRLPAPQIGAKNLELQGIFWGIAKPQAIIDRQIISVGDRVQDAEVESITRDSVILSRDGQKIELKQQLFRK